MIPIIEYYSSFDLILSSDNRYIVYCLEVN